MVAGPGIAKRLLSVHASATVESASAVHSTKTAGVHGRSNMAVAPMKSRDSVIVETATDRHWSCSIEVVISVDAAVIWRPPHHQR